MIEVFHQSQLKYSCKYQNNDTIWTSVTGSAYGASSYCKYSKQLTPYKPSIKLAYKLAEFDQNRNEKMDENETGMLTHGTCGAKFSKKWEEFFLKIVNLYKVKVQFVTPPGNYISFDNLIC